MNDQISIGDSIPLPAPPTGWFDYDYAVLANGGLALVRTDRDLHAEYRQWRNRVRDGDVHALRPHFRESRLRLSKFDGGAEIGAIEVSAGPAPKVDRLADGRWLVASSRTAPDENNARLFATDGTPAGAFSIGDGISHIRCAPDNTIWVGYFDEGIFAPPDAEGSSPVSTSGVARFTPDGRVLWRFNSEAAGLFIAGCYALTLEGNTLWCCPYTDFPIVRVEDGRVSHWENDIAGAGALAVDGDYVLLAGGYKENADQIALLRLLDARAQKFGKWDFRRPPRNAAHLLQGLGAALHIVGQGRWTKLSLPVLRAASKH